MTGSDTKVSRLDDLGQLYALSSRAINERIVELQSRLGVLEERARVDPTNPVHLGRLLLCERVLLETIDFLRG